MGKKTVNKTLKGFFDSMLEKVSKNPYSQESQRKITMPSKFNVCHIFPKKTYKSVEEDEENIIFLIWQEHTRFDYLLMSCMFAQIKKEFPNVWKIILERFDSLNSKITERKNIINKFEKFIEDEKK